MSTEYHVTGIGVGKKNGSFWPEWELRAPDGNKTNPLIPDLLNISISKDIYCIGFRKPGDKSLMPCPTKSVGSIQCEQCEKWTNMLACLRCRGDRCRNPERADDCIQPNNHILYLAAYAPDMYKVGVARAGRKWQRVWEQGARAGLIIAYGDGLMIRRWEEQLRKGGIRDRWSRSDHERALQWDGDPQELLNDLNLLRSRFRPRYPLIEWLEEPESHLFHSPFVGWGKMWRLHGEEVVRARVRGVCGKIMILQRADGEVLVHAKDLTGRKIIIGNESEPDAGSGYQMLLPTG